MSTLQYETDPKVIASIQTFPYLSIAEHTEVIKARAEMLANGAAPLVPVIIRELDDEMAVAYRELHTGMLGQHMFVERKFPNIHHQPLYQTVKIPLYMIKLKDDY